MVAFVVTDSEPRAITSTESCIQLKSLGEDLQRLRLLTHQRECRGRDVRRGQASLFNLLGV